MKEKKTRRNFSQEFKDEFYELYLVALNTGLRRGELLGLCWDCVDFSSKQLIISRTRDRYGLKETTKTGRIRYVPLNEIALNCLQELHGKSRSSGCSSRVSCEKKLPSSDFVFKRKNGRMIELTHFGSRKFQEAVARAQVPPIRFHDLRSTFASNFVMSGGNIYALSRILGHSTVEMTASKYAHLHPSYLRKEIEVVSFNGEKPKFSGGLRLIESAKGYRK